MKWEPIRTLYLNWIGRSRGLPAVAMYSITNNISVYVEKFRGRVCPPESRRLYQHFRLLFLCLSVRGVSVCAGPLDSIVPSMKWEISPCTFHDWGNEMVSHRFSSIRSQLLGWACTAWHCACAELTRSSPEWAQESHYSIMLRQDQAWDG